jgi:hypothetical protein
LGLKVKFATVKGMRIGEVARQAGITCSAIRFYEGLGLLPEPQRTASGYRDYDQSVVGRSRGLDPADCPPESICRILNTGR